MINFDVENHNGAYATYRQQEQDNIDYLFAAINKRHSEAVAPQLPQEPPTKRGFLARWLSL